MSRHKVSRAALGLLLALWAFGPMASAREAKQGKESKEANSEAAGASGFGNLTFTSRKEPIQITSQKLDFDYKNRRTVFRGDVEVVQGDVHLRSDLLTVDYTQDGDQQQLKEVTADGNVKITQGGRKATGNHAVFDQTARTLVLSGNAVLEEGSNQVNGDRIVVHPDDSRMEVLGENRRVKVILFPGQGSLASGTRETVAPKVPTPSLGERTPAAETSSDGASQSP
ncbi:MAG: lipopolysaccharide transport periplasmic protein LptA [Candidatus Binatia bacterium]